MLPPRLALMLLLAVAPACDRETDEARDATDAPADVAAEADDATIDGDAVEDTPVETLSEVDEPDADAGAEDAAPPCLEPEAECTVAACHAPPFGVTCIAGTVRDDGGTPIGNQVVSACLDGRCFSGRSREDGWFALRLPGSLSNSLGMHFPSDPPRLEPFCRFRNLCDGPVHVCDDLRLYPAPTAGTAVPLAPPPDSPLPADLRIEADDGAALVLPAGAVVLLPIGLPDWMALTRFPLEEYVPCFLDPARLPLALWAVTPGNSQIIEPGTMTEPVLRAAGLDLPNEFGLAPGTAVDVYMVGGGHQETGLETGEWAPMATATVTADGTRIHTDPGQGLGDLTWFGIYAAE